MSDRFKYSFNGIYRCENFAQCAENGNFPSRNIGYTSGFHWSIKFTTKLRHGSIVAYPFIYHYGKLKTQIRAYFNIIKKDGSSSFQTDCEHLYLESSEGCIGKYIKIEELLDEDNGYLDDGALTVEYGLQVESVEWEDGIWRFYFHDKFFNWQTKDDTYIRFETKNIDDTTFVYPFISSDDREDQVQVRAYFNIVKKDGSSSFETDSEHLYLKSNEGCIGEYMDVEKVLDENNGYLDEGTLTVEYGFHVESVEEDGVWKFNFFNPLFDSKNQDNMFTFRCPHLNPIYCHKLLTKLHSNSFSDCDRRCQRFKSSIVRSRDLAACLQIAHGVRLQPSAIGFQNVIRVAFQLGLFNTVRYCERQLIEMDWQMVSTAEKFEWAVKYNMRCLLIDLLKNIKSTKQLIAFLSILDLEKMPSESLKACVTKLFS